MDYSLLQAESGLFADDGHVIYLKMVHLQTLLEGSEDDLIDRVLGYARLHDYVKYTSTLQEAWRISIAGLSDAMVKALHHYDGIPELGPDEDFSHDPVATFAITEAQKHRERGVTLSMFLGLMKYYRQSYIDLISAADDPDIDKAWCMLFINRFYDRLEIGLCSEWLERGEKKKTRELQSSNRSMTNEKNKYLTIFESLHEPVVLLNSENRIENMNHAATALMEDSPVYGRSYYDQGPGKVFPWLTDEIEQFISSGMTEGRFEKELPTVIGARHIIIKMKKMLDVSEKFSGTVIILNDVTDQKEMEKRLRQMATTDSLTGIYNRGWYLSLTQEESKRSRRNGAPLSVVLADIDNFKKINDTFGHQIGDEVIRKTCVIFREQLREYDILGRLGGEEFGITMIECDLKKAASIADRLRKVLALCELPHDGRALRFTVSLGVAQYHQSDPNVGEVLRRADRALYAAKNSGRNCVREAS